MDSGNENNKDSSEVAGAKNSDASIVPLARQTALGSMKTTRLDRVPLINKLPASRRMLVLLVVGILLLAGVGYAVWQQVDTLTTNMQKTDPPYTMTDEEFAKVRASSLRNDAPDKNASVAEKKEYYDELMTTELTAHNFSAVVSTYEEASKLFKETDLTFNMYVAAAQAYAKLGDRAKALAVLDNAEQFVKKTTPGAVEAGDLQRTVTYFREEISR